MMAILLGERQVILPGSGAAEESRIRCGLLNMANRLQKKISL
jgi:hypothetical protein